MNEILRLADGSEFSLVTNGIKTNANTLANQYLLFALVIYGYGVMEAQH